MSEELVNFGHGHVFPRKDGAKARCGGAGICDQCSRDSARKNASEQIPGRLAAFKEAIAEIEGWEALHVKAHAEFPYADKASADREHANTMRLLACIKGRIQVRAGLKPDLSKMRTDSK